MTVPQVRSILPGREIVSCVAGEGERRILCVEHRAERQLFGRESTPDRYVEVVGGGISAALRIE